jgi:molecular chaperone GrpE
LSERPDPVTEPDTATTPPEGEVADVVVGPFPSPAQPPADGAAPQDGTVPVDGRAPEDDGEPAEAGAVDADPHTALAEVEEDPRTREELLVAAHEAERQRDEYLDDLRRARAEFENFRRRTGREQAAAREAGRGDVATALLEVLDDLDRTLEASEGSSDETLVKGVTLVAHKLTGTLTQLGLARLDPTGETFDPTLHEAVQHVPAEEPVDTPVVERTLRAGYRLGDRVLRPAMVVVKG